MKHIQQKMWLYASFIAIGIVLILLQLVVQTPADATFLSGFGIGMLVVGGVKLARAVALLKDSERLREYEAALKDERYAFLANKARAMVFYLSIYLELAVGLIALFAFRQQTVMQILFALVCIQTFAYAILFRVFAAKY